MRLHVAWPKWSWSVKQKPKQVPTPLKTWLQVRKRAKTSCDTISPMRYVVFDLETQNIFSEVSGSDPASLDISVATVYDSGTDSYTTVTVDEIERLWPIIEQADVLVGYNSNHFDIPLLNKYYPGDLTQIKSIDLLEDIKISLGRRLRLDSVAQATVGAKKSADGLQAVRWW